MDVDRRKDFYRNVYKIAIPITLQSLIMALLFLTDQLMVGQLGDTAIASVGIATKVFGVISVVLAGLATGVSVYTAQFWGKQDRKSISQLLGLGLLSGFVLAFLFTLLVFFEPKLIIGFFTVDERMIDEGYIFLKIVALSYIPTMLTMMYSSILRSTEHVKFPMYASLVTVCMNVVLNYLLIFGHFGFPEMGLKGSAVAMVISRIFECLLIIGAVYKFRLPGSVDFKNLFGISKPLALKFLSTTYPIIMTELVWVLGETVYAVVYSRMGTVEMTAMTITFPLQGLSIGLLSGLASAAGVMVGNKLGAGEKDIAINYAKKFIRFGITISVSLGVLIALAAPLYVSAFNISSEANQLGIYIIWVFSAFMWVKVANMIIAGGILQSGGDSKFVFTMEATATWLIGVPSALLMSFVWKQPIFWVYLVLSLEEVVRFGMGMMRIYSKKWVKNLVEGIAA